jgi:hypothetical protein
MGKQAGVAPGLIELEEKFNVLRGDDSPAAVQERAALRAKLKRVTHEEIHPNEEWVRVQVPLQADRNPYRINEEVFFGSVEVPACQARELLYMIQQNRQMEIDRMRENGREVITGAVADRAQMIQREG